VTILDRYILREMVVPFFLGLAIFTSILLIVRILKLVELVVNRGVPLAQMVRIFSYIMPAFLEVTVPMALLLAILVAFGRLSSDSEVIAMRAAGISLYRLLVPVAIFAGMVALLTAWLSVTARPWGNSHLRQGLYEIVKTRAAAGIKPKVFNDEFKNLVIYVDRIRPAASRIAHVAVHGHAVALPRSYYARREHRLAVAPKVVGIAGRQADLRRKRKAATTPAKGVVFGIQSRIAET